MTGAGPAYRQIQLVTPLARSVWHDRSLLAQDLPTLYRAVALNRFIDQQGSSDYGGMFAMSIVSLAPLFVVFLFGQRYLVRGIATTGIK